MKKLLFALIVIIPLLSIGQNDSIIPFVDGKIKFEKIIDIPGKTAKQLYSDAKLMIADIYRSGKAVVDVADNEALFIVVKGIAQYPLNDGFGTIQQKLEHTLKLQFKDEKIKITFTDLVVYRVNAECIVEPCKGLRYSQKVRELHKKGILSVWDDLQMTIGNQLKTKTDNW